MVSQTWSQSRGKVIAVKLKFIQADFSGLSHSLTEEATLYPYTIIFNEISIFIRAILVTSIYS